MKALVVDDTKNIRVLLTTCLELLGYEVTTAADGFETLNILQKNKFDLIFLDIKLHEISGTEVLRRIRSTGIVTPVVIMTAFGTVKNAIECTKLGAVAYLQKPFTADKVKIMIEELNKNPLTEKDNLELNISKCKNLIAQEEIDEAFNLLKTQLSIDPTYSEIYSLLAEIYNKKGDKINQQRFNDIANILI